MGSDPQPVEALQYWICTLRPPMTPTDLLYIIVDGGGLTAIFIALPLIKQLRR